MGPTRGHRTFELGRGLTTGQDVVGGQVKVVPLNTSGGFGDQFQVIRYYRRNVFTTAPFVNGHAHNNVRKRGLTLGGDQTTPPSFSGPFVPEM